MYGTHSDTLILAHVVWATKRRARLLQASFDRPLRHFIIDALATRDAALRAFGAAEDHVHVLVQIEATERLCDVVKSMKGCSAHRWNQTPPDGAEALYWQDGYWARSVSIDGVPALSSYLSAQRVHHAAPQPPEAWERALFPAGPIERGARRTR